MSNLAVKYKQQAQEEVQIQTPHSRWFNQKLKRRLQESKTVVCSVYWLLLYACVAFIGNKAGLYQVNVEAATIEQKLYSSKKKIKSYRLK